ncbi:MAG: LuxR C-terminal-related transcriptional regulator [Muribaculum sp.]|nr:LuxR C-terminal-related transcriptional regulator [Muribaculaceae bacterium]MCM1080236.1 LuxR C-terminal-related transcriptional regulator [Muribaculum sp.]
MLTDQSTYTRTDSLRDIIEDNNQLLVVLNRFDIALGFGDGTVEQVCAENGVDTETFLAVINFISRKRWEAYNISPMSLIGYLRKSHSRFLEYSLPYIKRILIEGIHESENSEIAIVILRFYDSYIEEVRSHMEYEDSVIFSYVENLLSGVISDRFKIADFSSSHDNMAAQLDKLKELFIYKYKQKNNEIINTALIHLMLCGKELSQHCEIENHMLFPQVERLEREIQKRSTVKVAPAKDDSGSDDTLTEREKEVLRWVALGLATKEIADKMCLSIHTVNTYRKSISSKLKIHSVTGLAFYAVLHHIIDINEVQLP